MVGNAEIILAAGLLLADQTLDTANLITFRVQTVVICGHYRLHQTRLRCLSAPYDIDAFVMAEDDGDQLVTKPFKFVTGECSLNSVLNVMMTELILCSR